MNGRLYSRRLMTQNLIESTLICSKAILAWCHLVYDLTKLMMLPNKFLIIMILWYLLEVKISFIMPVCSENISLALVHSFRWGNTYTNKLNVH